MPVASPVFASVDENKRFGEAVRRAVAKSKNKVAILASGSLSHQLFPNSQLGPEAWNWISSEFNRQMDLRVLDLWKERRYAEFCAMLPDYTRKCSGEAARWAGTAIWANPNSSATISPRAAADR